uniref:YitH acetyltransferase (GNAT) domain-containing protein n=1 Tax=Plectus sambesii TaxID=2011161 RepID=A0A914UXP5_9BILA
MADQLLLRYVESEQDVIELEKLAAKAHFDIGIHDRSLQWRYTPKTHVVMLDKDTKKIVGYVTANYISSNIFMRAHVYIEKAYRTKHTMLDVTPILDKTMIPKEPDTNIAHNCNGIMIKAAIRPEKGYIIAEKLLSYEGKIDHANLRHFNKPIDGVTVRLINSDSDLVQLLAYDKAMHSLGDREAFMSQWCTNDGVHATTAIALSSSGVCVGFASLRRAISLIEPAYAESEAIGISLLSTVLLTLPENDIAQITYPASQGAVVAFCTAQGWSSCMTEHRCYSKRNIILPWSKIFATHDFFPL